MYDSMTVVDTDELIELKRQAEEINKRIAELTSPKDLASRCEVMPYSLPGFRFNDARCQVIFSGRYDTDAWAHFLALGKIIHAKNGIFKARGGFRHPYYVDEIGKRYPKKVVELSQEEARISAEMLDKMISVYNEYMVRMHTHVLLEGIDGKITEVPVESPETEK